MAASVKSLDPSSNLEMSLDSEFSVPQKWYEDLCGFTKRLKKKKIEPSFFSSRKTLKKPCRKTEDKQVVVPQKDAWHQHICTNTYRYAVSVDEIHDYIPWKVEGDHEHGWPENVPRQYM